MVNVYKKSNVNKLKEKMNRKLQNVLLGFSLGVMIAASVWLLLISAIEMAEESGGIFWFPSSFGFLLGILFLLMLDKLIPPIYI